MAAPRPSSGQRMASCGGGKWNCKQRQTPPTLRSNLESQFCQDRCRAVLKHLRRYYSNNPEQVAKQMLERMSCGGSFQGLST